VSISVQVKRATAAQWTAANPVLLDGQQGYERDTGRMKIGDGTTAWTSLAYRFESGGGGVSDGDKGDITVSSGGATWTIDNGAVTLAKQANMATASVVYRKTSGSGAPEVQTLATLKTDLGLTGTNSGDQTTIAGITGTKAEFDAAVTDGNFLYVGDVTTNATHTGDATGATALTLATVNSNVGSFGSATQVATFTVNAKGLTTAAGNTTISVPATAISDSTTAGRAMVTAATAAAQTALLDVATSGAKGLAPASGGGTSNFLRADLTWASPGGGGGTPPDIQDFSTPGSSTWTKPAGAVMVLVTMFGAGGGGGGGRVRADSSTVAAGGAGGGGGGFNFLQIPASELGATETVVIGAGGTAGLGRDTTAQNGGNGGAGGATSFGAFGVRPGLGGNGGTTTAPSGGIGGGTLVASGSGGTNYGNTGAAGALGAAGTIANRGAIGGGAGAGAPGFAAAGTTAQAGAAGGLGGSLYDGSSSATTGGGGTAGTASGGAGGAGADGAGNVVGGAGGGSGGNGGTTADGGAGGAGGNPGGGGGGGGAATLLFASGPGGPGGNAFIRVVTLF
jgi:hypothetical protein